MTHRIEVECRFHTNRHDRLFLAIKLIQNDEYLDIQLGKILTYLFKHEESFHPDDLEFCYCLAKCLKKVDIDGTIYQAIPSDFDMALVFERAHQYGVHFTWLNEEEKHTVQFNRSIPLPVAVKPKQTKLQLSLVQRTAILQQPLSWLIFDFDGKIVVFSNGFVFIRPPQPLFDLINQLLDTETLTLNEKKATQFVKTVYRPFEQYLQWQVSGSLDKFVPETIDPVPFLEVTGSDTQGISVQLKYEYLNTIIDNQYEEPTIRDRDTQQLIQRQPEMEGIYQQDLMNLFLEHDCPFSLEGPGDKATFINRILPVLAEREWIIKSDVESLKIADKPAKLNFTIHQDPGQDWFHFDPNCDIDGQSFSLQEIARLMVQNKGYIKTKNQYVKLSDQSQSELELLAKAGAFSVNKTFNKQEMVPLATLTHSVAGERAGDFIDQINSLRNTPPTIDESLVNAELRDYQKSGVEWLLAVQRLGCGSLLADDMGLGKTLQCITLFSQAKNGPFLVVGPTNVIYNWESEIKRFTPHLNPIVYRGENRKNIWKSLSDDSVVIATYGVVKNDIAQFKATQFEVAVLDEAQAIKNPDTQISKAVKQLNAQYKVALTGTPIENRMTDLWNIIDFLMPNFLGSNKEFEIKVKDKQLDDIRHKVKPFILRRVKQEVLDSLPDKIESNIMCELSESQTTLYKTVLDAARKGIQESNGKRDKLSMLTALLKLRQVCSHPGMLSELGGSHYESSKFETLKTQLSELIEENHKVVVFSQFTRMLDIIQEWLESKSINFERIDGSVNSKSRQDRVNRFQDSVDPGVFIISLKAGGMGINLTAADYVIHMDPWWNPAVEAQATDRVHRMGQQSTVMVYRLIAKGTIEEQILKLQEEKRALFSQIVDVEDVDSAEINLDEVKNLLLTP